VRDILDIVKKDVMLIWEKVIEELDPNFEELLNFYFRKIGKPDCRTLIYNNPKEFRDSVRQILGWAGWALLLDNILKKARELGYNEEIVLEYFDKFE